MRFVPFLLFAATSHLLAADISSECATANREALLVAAQRPAEAEARFSDLLSKMSASADNKVCLGVTLYNFALVSDRLGKASVAEQSVMRSINALEEAVGPRDPLLRAPLVFLAQIAVRKEQLSKAGTLLSRAESLPEATPADLATMKGLRADLLFQAGAFVEAEESYRKSLEENDLAGRGQTSIVVPELDNLAILYITQHRVPEALRLIERSVALTDTPTGDLENRLQSRLLMAICLALEKDKQQADRYFKQAVDLLDGLPAAVRPALGRCVYLHYASFLHDTGRKREGNSFKQKAQALFGSDPAAFTVSIDTLLAKR